MPVYDKKDVPKGEFGPGVDRWTLLDGATGAEALTVADLTIEPGGSVPVHYHPTNEEAMVILEGEVDAILGEEIIHMTKMQTLLAPRNVKHGFVNRYDKPVRVMAIHPHPNPVRILVEE